MTAEIPQDAHEITPTLAKKLVKNVNGIEEQIKKDFDRIKQSGQNIEDKIVTVLLGPTGSGKTTLYYALTGKRLIPSKMGVERILNATVPENHFKIGNTGLSETHIPGIEYDSDTDLVFCDCPGFFDNRGEIQDITNSFAICRVLSQAKNIKILLLASHPDIRATRGKALRECCQLVETLIPDQQSLRPAISLIITHVNQDDIDDANDSDGDGLLGNVELGRTGWLLKYFRDHEKSNKKVVFTFPRPTKKEIQDKEYNGFDRQLILDFIRKGRPTPIVPFVSLSTEAKLMLLSVVDSFGVLSKILQEFELRLQVSSTESDEDLDIWKDRIEEFAKGSYPSPKDLVDKARELINPTTPLYENIYDSLMKIHNWRSFLELIVRDELSSDDQVLYRESPLMSPVFLDITEYFGKLLLALHSIIIEKIKKREVEKERNAAFEEIKAAKEREDKAIKERDEQRELISQKEYELKLLVEQQKNEIEKYKMQVELERHKAALTAQNQPRQDNGPAYISALAPILTALISKQ
ncbi:hypothetical protein M9Y10_033532 [Tritrichomonas musculus]|uniref:G domain-containing protein n=1 Tax=Tritrichomonas musculus TaxID=1915356 RepID=A0ABR2KD25_9EUKA